MGNYFEDAKERLEKRIPESHSKEFERMRNEIRKKLDREECDFLLFLRQLKIIILGDWYTEEKKRIIYDVKDNLLRHGLFAQTIDDYYDPSKKGGLSPVKVLQTCCINHQLIVFLDGDGKGTVTEQNYIAENYWFQGKVIFFIAEEKFNGLKDDPSAYIKNFPTIITYRENELVEKVFIYSRLRVYRLGEIISRQAAMKRGPHGSNYVRWKDRITIK
jgi:hypothetical protein